MHFWGLAESLIKDRAATEIREGGSRGSEGVRNDVGEDPAVTLDKRVTVSK